MKNHSRYRLACRLSQMHFYRPGTNPAKRFSCVPSMFDSLGVQVPCTT